MSSPTPAGAYRADVDGLRAVAVLAVLGFHSFPGRVQGGFVGVDVFFVISGFLISGIILGGLDAGSFSFVEFYARRVRRIFPALIVVLAATVAFGYVALLPGEYRQLSRHVVAGAGFSSNLLLWTEAGYFDGSAESKPLLHLWSLGVEEQFYLFWPLLLALLWRARRSPLAALGLFAAVSFGLNLALVGGSPTAAFYLPFTRFWELAIGACLSVVTVRRAGAPSRWDAALARLAPSPAARRRALDAMALAGLAAILASVVLFNGQMTFPGAAALAPTLGAGLLIAAGPEAWLNRHLLANRAVVFVGLISYPLYLWHWPILSYLHVLDWFGAGFKARVLMKLGANGAAFVLAILTWRLLEHRLRHRPARALVKRATLALLVPVAAAGVVLATGGAPGRVDASVVEDPGFDGAQFGTPCTGDYPLPAESFCRIRDRGAPFDTLLLGDSHARATFPALASRGNVLLLGHTGCFPAPGLDGHNRREFVAANCLLSNERVYEIARADARIRTVVLAARGTLYLTGRGYGPAEDGLYDWTLSFQGRDEPPATVLREGLAAALETLTAAGKQVIVLLQVPELGFAVQQCVALRPIDRLRTLRSPCAVPREAAEARQHEYRQLVTEVAARFPAVRVFDPWTVLCDATWCHAMRDGVVLYRDDDHLSPEGARYVWDRLGPPAAP